MSSSTLDRATLIDAFRQMAATPNDVPFDLWCNGLTEVLAIVREAPPPSSPPRVASDANLLCHAYLCVQACLAPRWDWRLVTSTQRCERCGSGDARSSRRSAHWPSAPACVTYDLLSMASCRADAFPAARSLPTAKNSPATFGRVQGTNGRSGGGAAP